MPLKKYGVLVGSVAEVRPAIPSNPHLQVKVMDRATAYRLAVNVRSSLRPNEVLYVVNERFAHPILPALFALTSGWHPLSSRPGGVSLDYIRGNLFDPSEMRPLPFDLPGADNDLNEKVGYFIERAVRDPEARLFAYGERFGPEAIPDKIFGFLPGNGLHDIHMNQGNDRSHSRDNGVYQDGGILLHFPGLGQTVAIFLAFQSQTWHTDDGRGFALPGFRPGMLRRLPHSVPEPPVIAVTEGIEPPYPWGNAIRIVAALVNPVGDDAIGNGESVTLLNTTAETIPLDGWQLADTAKNTLDLAPFVSIAAGETLRIAPSGAINFGNKGGILTVLREGIKVHGVAYTREQASVEGATLFFS